MVRKTQAGKLLHSFFPYCCLKIRHGHILQAQKQLWKMLPDNHEIDHFLSLIIVKHLCPGALHWKLIWAQIVTLPIDKIFPLTGLLESLHQSISYSRQGREMDLLPGVLPFSKIPYTILISSTAYFYYWQNLFRSIYMVSLESFNWIFH